MIAPEASWKENTDQIRFLSLDGRVLQPCHFKVATVLRKTGERPRTGRTECNILGSSSGGRRSRDDNIRDWDFRKKDKVVLCLIN